MKKVLKPRDLTVHVYKGFFYFLFYVFEQLLSVGRLLNWCAVSLL